MDAVVPSTVPPAKPMPAKPRFWWRTIGISVLVMLSLPVIYYFFSAWQGDREMQRICAEIEAEDPHWQWSDLIASMPPAPDDENAFVQIRKVKDLLKTTPFTIAPVWDSEAKKKSLQVRNARLSADSIELLRAAFAPLDPAVLPAARTIKNLPKGRMKIDATVNPFALSLSEVQDTREVMRLLDSDVLLRMNDNDLEGAVESWHALLNTAHAIEDNPTLVGQLVRMAGQAIAIAALERMLGQGELAESDLVKIQNLLRRETEDNLLYHGMRGERAIAHRMYLDLRDGKVSMSNMLGGMGNQQGFIDRVADLFPNMILSGYSEHLRLAHEQVKASKLPEGERMDAMAVVEQKARDSRNLATKLLLPATTKVAQASQRTQAQLRSAMVAVAAERYRAKNDALPLSFDDLLKEGTLKAIPIDPWNGKSLRIQRTPTGVIVYSVGQDGIDNQGALNRSNPIAPGADLGFELWDRHLRAVLPPVEVEK